jgi:hypothetical protein
VRYAVSVASPARQRVGQSKADVKKDKTRVCEMGGVLVNLVNLMVV